MDDGESSLYEFLSVLMALVLMAVVLLVEVCS